MSDVMIRAEGVGKRYALGRGPGYKTLRESINTTFSRPLQALRNFTNSFTKSPPPTLWALRDVSFNINRGDVVGIIGRNGSGKSTLLKVLSRITEPTAGEVDLRGRVGSLLEVGTGFHPELTGRENIYLNGAILGMKRLEIKGKFDEITAFAEVDQFLDTPVKHYSTGMRMRLAFAVAANLDTEILLVDEVLAVGDLVFQKRCLGKMGDVARQGRTVLFVSHNLDAVRHLCRTSLVLNTGRVEYLGQVEEGLEYYSRQNQPAADKDGRASHVVYEAAPGAEEAARLTGDAFIRSLEFFGPNGEPCPTPQTWEPLTIRANFRVFKPVTNLHVVLQISSHYGTKLAQLFSADHVQYTDVTSGDGFAECHIPKLPLGGGDYLLGAGLGVPRVSLFDYREDSAVFKVEPRDVFNCGRAPVAPYSQLVIDHTWTIHRGEVG